MPTPVTWLVRAAWTLLVTLSTACRAAHGIPRPPSYEDCVPTHRFYHDLAASTEDMSAPGEVSSDPDVALDRVLDDLESQGIALVPKASGIEDWSKFTTTFPDTIFLGRDFPTWSVAERAEILWHERVHVREYERLGVERFLVVYAFAEGRWALEVQAYRESFRVMRTFGISEDVVLGLMRPRAESLYDNYDLDQMPRECAVQGAIDVWMLDVESVP